MINASIVFKITMLGKCRSGPKPIARTRRTTATPNGGTNRAKLPVMLCTPQVTENDTTRSSVACHENPET